MTAEERPDFWGLEASFPKTKYRIEETVDGYDLYVWDDGAYK